MVTQFAYMLDSKEGKIMNELKKYIAPSAQISFCDFDIITASPASGGGSGDPINTPGGGKSPDDWDTGL